MKVALVHDQLAEFGGAERVLISLKKAYPQADVYVSFIDWKRLGIHADIFRDWKIYESRARFIPFFSRLYSPLRFLLPWIWRSFDLSHYDLVICSSSWGMSKGVSLAKRKTQNVKRKTHAESLHTSHFTKYVCYLHTPPRYLYGYDESDLRKYLLVRIYAAIVNHFLRSYDYESSQTIDEFVFNAEEIRQRSLKFYRRDGTVIHPPIQIPNTKYQIPSGSQKTAIQDLGPWNLELGTYYLTVSRLAPTKHIDMLIRACNKLKKKLVVVGAGNQESYLKSIAGSTIVFTGHVDDAELDRLYAGAKAFLYASVDEDFGMVPVESMARGVPVIAYASGGVKETVSPERGVPYYELTIPAITDAINTYESFSHQRQEDMKRASVAFADSCGEDVFITRMQEYIHHYV